MSTERRASRTSEVAHPSRATAALTIGVIALVAAFLYLVRNALIPFVFAGVIAFVTTPAIDWAAARTRLPRWIFALLALLLLFGAFVLLGWLGVPSLLHQLAQVGSNLEGSIAEIVAQVIGKDTIDLFGKPMNAQGIARGVVTYAGAFLSTHAPSLLEYTFASMFGVILSWVLLGYMLFGGSAQGEALVWLLPPARRDLARRVWTELSPVLRRYFLGVLLVVIYASVAAYIGLGLILHIHDALFLALLTGLLEIIPVVGPVASGTIAGLVAVGQAQSSWNIIAYIIYAVALRVSIDEFFAPIVLGKAAYLPPVMVIFCFLAGGMLFGIVGVVMAVSVALAVKALLGEVYREEGLRQEA